MLAKKPNSKKKTCTQYSKDIPQKVDTRSEKLKDSV